MQVKRIYGLDILRASAILLVVYQHVYFILQNEVDKVYFWFLPDGVTAFFVLSGYLIGRILLQQINKADFSFQSVKRFWVRRWFRTLPAYYTIILLLLLHRYLTHSIHDPFQYFQYFLFVQNITHGQPRFFSESWSLSIEEWFYLLTPIVLYFSFRLSKVNKRGIVFFWIIFIILASTIFRLYETVDLNISTWHDWSIFIRRTIPNRFDSIMYGVLGAYLSYYNLKVWNRRRVMFVLGSLLIILTSVNYILFEFSWYAKYLRLTIEPLSVLMLLPILSNYNRSTGMVVKFFTFVSLISYSMYLINFTPFNEWILPRLSTWGGLNNARTLCPDLVRAAAFLIWAFAGAWVLYLVIEKPFMGFRDKLTSEKKDGPGNTAPLMKRDKSHKLPGNCKAHSRVCSGIINMIIEF